MEIMEVIEVKKDDKKKVKIELSSSIPGKQEVTLLKDHWDDGKFYSAGSKLAVDDSTLVFLISHGIVAVKNRS